MTLHLLMKLSDCAIKFKEQTLPVKTNGKTDNKASLVDLFALLYILQDI